MALSEQNIDVPLAVVDQKAPKTGGLVGSFTRLIDCQVTKYQGAPGSPPNLVRVDKRDAFMTLSDVVRSSSDGTVQVGATLANQTLLAEFANQALLVSNDKTHVYSGITQAWHRHDYQLPTFGLSQEFVHTSNSLATTPDVAQLAGVYCYTWVTEASHNAGGGTPVELPGCYLRVVDFDGVVLRSDSRLNATDTRVKVVTDGSVFWIFSEKGDGTGNFNVAIVDQHGVTLQSTTIACTYTSGDYWDVTSAFAGVLLAQPTGSGVQFNKLTFDAGTNSIARTNATDTTIAGFHRIAFLANGTFSGDGFAYLATAENVVPNNNTIHAYRVTSALAQNHHYTVATSVLDEPANLTGYVSDGASSIVVAWSVIDPTASPNTQYLKNTIGINSVTIGGSVVNIATIMSMNLASRAFFLGRSYYAVGFYPSNLAITGNTQVPNQPTYFLIPLSNSTQRTCGRWDYGQAYCDWQTSGSKYNFALASVVPAFPSGMRTALSYRAESFTTTSLVEGKSGVSHFNPFYLTSAVTSVGVKAFTFGDPGQAVALSGTLLLPGPMAATWSGGEFSEHNVALAFEQPTLTLVPTGGSPPALTPGTYQFIAVEEWTETNGDRVRSIPSPAATITVPSGNYVSVSGFMNHATNKKDLLISLYRSDMVPDSGGGFVPTTTHYKITVDAPTLNDSPLYNDNAQSVWSFADAHLNITGNEILYTDKGQLPNFPAPPFSRGCVWRDRVFLVAYDNSIWFSSEPTEGDALWFHAALRMTIPTNDRITAIAATTEGYLLVLCENSHWYFPATTLPDASGANGTIPSAVELKFNMGCTGQAIVTKLGCVYSSSAGGLWLITRDLQNTRLSEPLADTLGGQITALAIDSRQRIYAAATPYVGVYDLVSQCWYEWRAPAPVGLMSTYLGAVVFGDGSLVWQQSQGMFVDRKVQAGVTTLVPVLQGMTLNSLHFGGVRNFASLLEMQLVGDTHSASTVTLDLAFDDEDGTVESTSWATDPAVAFEYSYGPENQLCSAVGITLTESLAAGQTAGQGFSIEALALTVGLYQGQKRLPDNRRV